MTRPHLGRPHGASAHAPCRSLRERFPAIPSEAAGSPGWPFAALTTPTRPARVPRTGNRHFVVMAGTAQSRAGAVGAAEVLERADSNLSWIRRLSCCIAVVMDLAVAVWA